MRACRQGSILFALAVLEGLLLLLVLALLLTLELVGD